MHVFFLGEVKRLKELVSLKENNNNEIWTKNFESKITKQSDFFEKSNMNEWKEIWFI